MCRHATLGRLVHKADFERVLATRSLRRSTHFALHHLPGEPLALQTRRAIPGQAELSTGREEIGSMSVDDSSMPATPSALWAGCVVPKRHARRAVTRTLLKRQIRVAFERHVATLPGGLWLVRLRAPFAAEEFVSARSARLAATARSELDRLLAGAAG
ncbi:MAG: ribonuclease P protein component [Burkholderiaceae bacterium]|nr:ribonuclease P protein component [Burkholderiaceae bacterium]